MTTIGAIGVDLGGNTAVIAATMRNGVEVIDNEASHRETPVIIGFGDNERFIGEQGAAQLKSNFKNTIVFPTRFLGLDANSSFLQEEKKWLYSPLITLPNSRIAFEVTHNGETKTFLPEQAVAMMLQKIKDIARKAGLSPHEMVLSVPSYYTEHEKKALLDAAKIAGITVIRLMSENSATALSYGLFRRSELSANPRNVALIDVGHCSTSAYVASFTNEKMTMRSQVSERNLGVRDIDWNILEFYSQMIKSQYDANVMNNTKLRLRLLDAIAKQRKILSANSDATLNVDNVSEDADLSHTLTREKFEEIIAPVIERFRGLLLSLKAQVTTPLHSIEIVGGGTRIPIIQKLIQEIFGLECSRTLNASECIARGCAIQSAMLTPVFKVAPYQIEDINEYPIKCTWQFKNEKSMEIESDDEETSKKQTTVLFPKGCCVPNAKALSFEQDANIDLKLFYDESVPVQNKVLARFRIHSKVPSVEEFSMKIRLVLNRNGMVEVDEANLVEEYIEDNLARGPNKSGLQNMFGRHQQQEQEVQRNKKVRNLPLQVSETSLNSMSEAEINPLIGLEDRMAQQDKNIAETYEKKNELESYVYDVRGKLSDKLSSYVKPEDRDKLNEELSQIENWLYGDGFKAEKSAYQAKLDQLRGYMSNIEQRMNGFELVSDKIKEFSRVLSQYSGIAISREPEYLHISPQERAKLLQVIQNNKDWMKQIEQSLETGDKSNGAEAILEQIDQRMQAFVSEFSPLAVKGKGHTQTRSAEKPIPTPTNTTPRGSSHPNVNAPGSAGKTGRRQAQQKGNMYAPQPTRMEEEEEEENEQPRYQQQRQQPRYQQEPRFFDGLFGGDRPQRQSVYTPRSQQREEEYDGYPYYQQKPQYGNPRYVNRPSMQDSRHRPTQQPRGGNSGFFGGLNDYFGFPGFSWR